MTGFPNLLIRDGVQSDIPACLGLNHTYETDYVWQMSIQETTNQRQILFNTERLPRTMEVNYPVKPEQLTMALPAEHGFLVAVNRTDGYEETLGYLVLRTDTVNHVAHIHALVVSKPYRRQRIATRLTRVAIKWAKERQLTRMIVETQTKNYPAIQFCLEYGFGFSGFNDHYFYNQDIAVFFSRSLH